MRTIYQMLAVAMLATSPSLALAQTILDINISHNNDDAEEDAGASLERNNDKIRLGEMTWAGFRFRNVAVPPGATITNAYVQFTSETNNTESTDLTIFGDDADNSQTFSNGNKLSTRTRTSASVVWANVANWSTGGDYQTPSINAIIQEIVDRSGWSSGNNLSILIRSDDLDGKRLAWARDGSSSDAAILHVEYTTSSSPEELLRWSLDETSGSTAADSSGNGRDGTVNGTATWVAGRRNNGIDLDGSTTVEVADLLGQPTNFTVAAWARLDAADSGGADVVSVGNYITLRLNDAGTQTAIRFYNGSTYASATVSGSAEGAGWRHYVATFDDASDTIKIYIDGQLATTSSTTDSISWSGLGTNTVVGANGNGGANHDFDGTIDDVRVYNYALTETEIADVYGLVGHWTFDEGSGTTIADSSLKVNDASFNTGSPTWIEGIYGKALEFDSTNDAVTGSNFDPPDHGAVSLWIRSDGPPASRQRPWGVGADYEMWQDTDGLISFDISTDGFQGGFITDDALDSAGRWYHLVGQYDSVTENYEIYINGELHKSGVSTWDIKKQAADLLTFGTRTGSTQRFDGAVDDFRVYNRWLSVSEINDLYGRIAYWKLDETSGSVAVDSTDHGNDGTYTGSPTLGVNGAFVASTATAIALDGATEYVATTNSLMNDASAFTMLGWVRADSLAANQSFFGQNNVIEFGLDYTSGQLHLYTENGGSIDAYNQLPVGKWTHVAVTGDGASLKMYINGLESVTGGSSTGSYGTSSDVFKLGEGVFNPTGDFFDGRLDDVQVFDRALKPEELRAIYKGGRPAGVRILNWVEIR